MKFIYGLLISSIVLWIAVFSSDYIYNKGYDRAMKITGWVKIEPPMKIGNVEFLD